MTYLLEFSKEFDIIFEKLQKKNTKHREIITKKLREILRNPEHYKPLRHDMKGYRRVHIDKSFVLIFKIEGNRIIVQDYGHHDDIYRRRY